MKNNYRKITDRIKELKNIEPRAEWKTLNRDFLLSKISAENKSEPVRLSFQEYGRFFIQIIRQRFLLEPAIMILLVLGFSVSSSLAVNAAFYSLPGDPLYRMKIALERAQIAITPNGDKQMELKMEFAQKRVDEFDKIVAQTDVTPAVKKDRINLVMKELQRNAGEVNEHVSRSVLPSKNTPGEDLEKTLQMAFAISSKTEELAKSLDQKIGDLSAGEKVEVQVAVDQAVESVQQISVSAQELIKETQNQQADQANTTTTPAISSSTDQGVVEGAATSTINIQNVTDPTGQSANVGPETTPSIAESANSTTTDNKPE